MKKKVLGASEALQLRRQSGICGWKKRCAHSECGFGKGTVFRDPMLNADC
jgi:hypothetical protein